MLASAFKAVALVLKSLEKTAGFIEAPAEEPGCSPDAELRGGGRPLMEAGSRLQRP